MPAHPPLFTLVDAAMASCGTCHCYPELHYFPCWSANKQSVHDRENPGTSPPAVKK